MHWDMFWKEIENYFETVYEHVEIFGILYIARRHPTKLSEAYPPPLLYVGMPWGGGGLGLADYMFISAFESIYLISCHIVHLML